MRSRHEQNKVSDIPNRISKTNNFQNRRADFETEVNLSKKESIEAMSLHTKSVQFYLLQSKRTTVMDLRKETIKIEGCKPLLDMFQFIGIS
jgi:hypothetical protein